MLYLFVLEYLGKKIVRRFSLNSDLQALEYGIIIENATGFEVVYITDKYLKEILRKQ